MTIDEAIKTLNALPHQSYCFTSPDDQDAIKLSIEALKEIKALRFLHALDMTTPLPGETEK